jgi:hypothetical protein
MKDCRCGGFGPGLGAQPAAAQFLRRPSPGGQTSSVAPAICLRGEAFVTKDLLFDTDPGALLSS